MCAKRLSEIMTPGVIGVSPDTPFPSALELLRDKNISCILVLEDKKPVGIFTERKIVKLAAAQGLQFKNYVISEIMTSPVLTATRNMDIYSAYDLLSEHNIRHLVVIDDEKNLCGVVTQSDMMDHLGYEYFLEFKKVFQVMTRNLSTVSKDYSMDQALLEMAKISSSCLVVAEHERPVGIVTERDMTRLLINGTNTDRLTVKEIMSSPVHTVHLNLPLLEATRIMKEKHIRRLVVVNEEGEIVGLTTQSDIIKGLQTQYIKNLRQLVVEKDRELELTNKKLVEKTVYLDNILHSSVDMGMVATDLHYHIVYFNPAAEEFLGTPATEAIGRDIRKVHLNNVILTEHFGQFVEMLHERKRYEFSFVQQEEKGPRFMKALITGIWDPERNLVGFVFMLQDVTVRTLAETEIKRQKSDLELINAQLSALYSVSSTINQTLEMSTLLDDVLDVIIKIEIFNFQRRGVIFLVDEEKLQLVSQVGLEGSSFDRQQTIRIDDCVCDRALKTGEPVILGSGEIEEAGLEETTPYGVVIVPLKVKGKVIGVLRLYTSPDCARMKDTEITLLSAIGNQVGIAVENARLYEQTRFFSLYDPLTNVANRRLMDMGLENNFACAKRYGKPFSIIMLDIDNFKKYNDSHGHNAGDRMLAEIAQVLLDDIRDADSIARYGGEEFLIMLPETALKEAHAIAERIRKRVIEKTNTTISLGVASYSQEMAKKEDLINKADEALYRAKRIGKNRVEIES